MRTLMGRLFHISYAVGGTWRLLKRHSWAWQQCTGRAIERDDDVVEVWKTGLLRSLVILDLLIR
ncbi:winged helix-turn-helix domain-containing protein [Streptomyces sp. NPDC093228]|uniref:helix-turn-helix domain-containing protein n=1 Tax=Streptomyces sp. NPDC093228 TaxID=3155070 RepID=UPI0034175E26